MKKSLCILLAMIMIICLLPMTTSVAATAFAGGTGSADDPFQIADDEHLMFLAHRVNSGTTYEGMFFTLSADIDMSMNEFTPIGQDESTPFSGTIDGSGCTISNIRTNSTSGYAGLFGYTLGATIKNITLTNIEATGEISGSAVGYSSNSTIQDCNFNGDVNITGSAYSGGVVGMADEASSITNCSVEGTVTGTGSSGGIVGYAGSRTTIDGSFNYGDVTGEAFAGGIAGLADTSCTISNSGNYGAITANAIGGYANQIVGYGNATISDCYENGSINAQEGNLFADGTGSAADPFQIANGQQLTYLAQQVNVGTNYANTYFLMTADIVLNDTTNWQSWYDINEPTNTWIPIGSYDYPFAGHFDGGNYTVSGVYVNANGNAGLFGTTLGTSTIENLGVIDSYIHGDDNVGAIAGIADGSAISNCYNTGTVTGSYTGGIAGYSTAGTSFNFCYNEGLIQAVGETANLGGIVGAATDTSISNCYNIGTFSGPPITTCPTGGIAGVFSRGSIQNSYNASSSMGGGGAVTVTGNIAGRAGSDTTFSGLYYLESANVYFVSHAVGTYVDNGVESNNVSLPSTTQLTAAEMQVQSNFVGWDFDNIWTMAGDATYLYPELRDMPTLPEPEPITLTVTTLGGAAKSDKTAIRFGASISFADMAALNVGDTVDYGFSINGLKNYVLINMDWMKLSAASNAVSFTGFTWTAEMDAATTTEALAAVIRATGIKVYEYDATTITFAIVLNNMPLAAQDSLWVFQPYVTVNATDTSLGTAKYNSINRILEDIASDTYSANYTI